MTQPPRGALALLLTFLLVPAIAVTAPADDPPTAAPDAVPLLMHYQGRFTDPGGTPLAGPVKLVFRIHAAAAGGAVLWAETHPAVPLDDGVASVLLGSLVTLSPEVFAGSERYLAIVVDDGDELTPRQRLASVPYAFEAERLQGKAATDFEAEGAVAALSINDGNPPNTGSNRVNWNNLTGVPAGFADGEDVGITDHGQLQGLLGDDHPQYARLDELEATAGSGPNSGKNLVHWENLVGVPTGFADGADNAGEGGATDHGDLTGLGDDDHPQYALDTDLQTHAQAVDPHSQYALDTDLSAHAGDAAAHHDKTVDASELTAGTLDPARLPVDGITGANVLDGSLGRDDLVPGLLDTLVLSPGAVDSVNIVPGAVATVHLAAGAVTGDRLAPDAVTGSRVADGTLDGADVADGGLGVVDLLDEPGFEYAEDTDTFTLGDGVTAVVSRSIDCPADGYVLAIASGEACITPPPLSGDYTVRISISEDDDFEDADSMVSLRGFVSPGTYRCGGLTAQRLIPVTAGTHTLHLVGRGPTGLNGSLSRPRLTLLFLGTRY